MQTDELRRAYDRNTCSVCGNEIRIIAYKGTGFCGTAHAEGRETVPPEPATGPTGND